MKDFINSPPVLAKAEELAFVEVGDVVGETGAHVQKQPDDESKRYALPSTHTCAVPDSVCIHHLQVLSRG